MTRRSLALAIVIAIAALGVLAGAAGHGPLARVPIPYLHPGRATLALSPALLASRDTLRIADSAYARCHALVSAAKRPCYEDVFSLVDSASGVHAAMSTLDLVGARDRDVAWSGHEYAHMIGIRAFRLHPDVQATFSACTEEWQSGCYHGVIQTYLRQQQQVGATEVNALCRPWSADGVYGWLRFQCVHGMGHGLTMLYDHDLPRALEGCDLLAEEWDRRSCYGGAFMENIVHATEPHDHDMPGMVADHDMHLAHFKAIDSSDSQYPCSAVAERYRADCYTVQPSVMLNINGSDWSRTFAACDSAPGTMKYPCYQGTGTMISGATMRNHRESIKLCSLGDTRFQPWCYVGVVKNYVDVTAKFEDGASFCRDIPGRANRLKCDEAVGQEIGVLARTAPEREGMCAAVEADDREACRFGAQLTSTPPPLLPQEDPALARSLDPRPTMRHDTLPVS